MLRIVVPATLLLSILCTLQPDLMAYPDPVRLDLRAEWKHRSITLFASAYNLLDAEQMDRTSIVLPGRWISGGMQLRWNVRKQTTPTE